MPLLVTGKAAAQTADQTSAMATRLSPPTPKSSRRYEVTTDIAVGRMRQIDFLDDEEGDWALHCHKSHHTMNAMGHNVPTMIGVDHRGLVKPITKLIPDYMVMGVSAA